MTRAPQASAKSTNYLPPSIKAVLPTMVNTALTKYSAQQQQEFVEEFDRRSKDVGLAYVCWFFFGLQYAYQGKWGLQVLYWFSFGGLWIWMIADLFRMPGMIRSYNSDVAVDVLRNMSTLHN